MNLPPKVPTEGALWLADLAELWHIPVHALRKRLIQRTQLGDLESRSPSHSPREIFRNQSLTGCGDALYHRGVPPGCPQDGHYGAPLAATARPRKGRHLAETEPAPAAPSTPTLAACPPRSRKS